MTKRALTVLVVDDELLARERLDELLTQEERVGEVQFAENGVDAVATIRHQRPDLVFLDMQMPGMSGLDVVKTIGTDVMPVTVFITAYDEYAIRAFDVAALDYLLKPFEDERFRQSFARAVRQLELRAVDSAARRLVTLLGDGPPAAGSLRRGSDDDPDRMAIESGGEVHVLLVDDISHVTASGPYAELHTAERTFFVRETMRKLEERLARHGFFRVHRSTLVRIDRVRRLERGSSGGTSRVTLEDGTTVNVSRARVKALETRLGVRR